MKLFREVFSGKTLNKVTMRLAEHATCNLRRRRYLETIQWLIDPTVLGGMRIQVGDEVTDNTVVAQLQNLHRKVQTEATPA